MAKQFVLTEAELNQLVDGLELTKLREAAKQTGSVVRNQDIDDLHRVFHYHVVRWVQEVAGHKGR